MTRRYTEIAHDLTRETDRESGQCAAQHWQTLAEEIVANAWQLRRMRASKPKPAPATIPTLQSLTRNVRKRNDVLQKKLDRLARHKTRIERTFHRCLYEQDKQFHSMQSLIDARIAQQNSERTQLDTEPRAASPANGSASGAPAQHFETTYREFEEMAQGLAEIGSSELP